MLVICLSLLSLVWLLFPSLTETFELPLAPNDVRLLCRVGRSYSSDSRYLSVCPTSSASCGYFEFFNPSDDLPIGVYECVDASILSNESDTEEEKPKAHYFNQYCDDRPRCLTFHIDLFNPQFINYISRTRDIGLETIVDTKVRFCCAPQDVDLQRLIKSGKNLLPTSMDPQTYCGEERCRSGAIGCLSYSKKSKHHDDVMVEAVYFTYEDDLIETNSSDNGPVQYEDEVQKVETHCVYRHLNDELYRYCLLVHDGTWPTHCYHRLEYRICCCFFEQGVITCDPLSRLMEYNVVLSEEPSTRNLQEGNGISSISRIPLTTKRSIYSLSTPSPIRCWMDIVVDDKNVRHKKMICHSVAAGSPCSLLIIVLCCFIAMRSQAISRLDGSMS
ncbi:hypothetical protein AB6A40_006387 [Gnathostoma spinigerum]|uniref:Uncharacterized protein n=1 Tax=Gnathostoma spinigerum TaxID=75299 RepID=A0ABD6ERQ2_9BILA